MKPRASGFTLIEVLIALVVVSLVLAASMRAGGTMILTQDSLRRATLAGWSACPQIDLELVCVTEVRTTPNPAMRRIDVRVFDAADRNRQLAHRLAFQASLP
jgi:general secretion pathway protein I